MELHSLKGRNASDIEKCYFSSMNPPSTDHHRTTQPEETVQVPTSTAPNNATNGWHLVSVSSEQKSHEDINERFSNQKCGLNRSMNIVQRDCRNSNVEILDSCAVKDPLICQETSTLQDQTIPDLKKLSSSIVINRTESAASDVPSYWKCQNAVTITVKDLVYAVQEKELLPGCNSSWKTSKSLVGKKILLDHIHMIARPGELLAIVGPSGGGKTTLLNVLAMRSPSCRVPFGHVKFNGRQETKSTVKTSINYVMAHDKMLPYLTVYETLVAAADLKFPHLTREERLLRVETIIDDMGLQRCRNTYIGGEWRKGISTGEMKRVAIGVELLDEPSVLILDEPTSGLDSKLSLRIIELLLKEARKGRTVITTIHQPSSQIYEILDRFLLVSHGEVVFYGPTDQALPYFARLGYIAHKDWNPSDFLLSLVSDSPESTQKLTGTQLGESDANGQSCRQKRLNLISAWKHSEEHQQLVNDIENIETTIHKKVPRGKQWKRKPWGRQVVTLWKRQTRNSVRNPLTAIVTLLVQCMQGLILGGIFFHLSKVESGKGAKPLLDLSFWNNPWVLAYNNGVNFDSKHPVVDVFEQGLDGNGSYALFDRDSSNSDWQVPIHYMLDRTITCIYNTPELKMRELGYPRLTEMDNSAAADWDSWTPRRIYSNVMAAYQIFNREWSAENPKDVVYWGFFRDCNAAYPERPTKFYRCLLEKGYKTMNPLAVCTGLSPLPIETSMSDSKGDSRDPIIENQVEMTRRLMSISNTMGLDQSIQNILGEDLMKFVNAGSEWITRMTSCSDPICDKLKGVRDLFATGATKTIDTVSGVLNLSGCLFFVVSVLGFASYDALLTFPQERALFNRETANGLYCPSSYYIAKNLADFPFQIIPCMVMATIFYFMVGFDVTIKQYFIYFSVCVLTTFCAYGFGYMVSAGAPRMEIAILVAPLTLVIWLTLAGFFLRDGDVPPWISYFKYLSFYRWGFFALVLNQFPVDGYFGNLPNTFHLALSGVTETNLTLCIGVLITLGIVYRILGFIFLATTNRRVGLEA